MAMQRTAAAVVLLGLLCTGPALELAAQADDHLLLQFQAKGKPITTEKMAENDTDHEMDNTSLLKNATGNVSLSEPRGDKLRRLQAAYDAEEEDLGEENVTDNASLAENATQQVRGRVSGSSENATENISLAENTTRVRGENATKASDDGADNSTAALLEEDGAPLDEDVIGDGRIEKEPMSALGTVGTDSDEAVAEVDTEAEAEAKELPLVPNVHPDASTIDMAYEEHPGRSRPDSSSYDERHHPDHPWDWAPDHPVTYDRRRSIGDTQHPLDHPDHARFHPDAPVPYGPWPYLHPHSQPFNGDIPYDSSNPGATSFAHVPDQGAAAGAFPGYDGGASMAMGAVGFNGFGAPMGYGMDMGNGFGMEGFGMGGFGMGGFGMEPFR